MSKLTLRQFAKNTAKRMGVKLNSYRVYRNIRNQSDDVAMHLVHNSEQPYTPAECVKSIKSVLNIKD